MLTKTRNLLASCTVATIAAAAATLPVSAQTKINVAHVFANDFLPMFIAKENGCFAKRNLDVTGAWAKANGKTIGEMRVCLAEAVEQIAKQPDEAKKVELQYVKANAPVYAKFESKVTAADLKIHADIATDMGLLTKPAKLDAMVLP